MLEMDELMVDSRGKRMHTSTSQMPALNVIIGAIDILGRINCVQRGVGFLSDQIMMVKLL